MIKCTNLITIRWYLNGTELQRANSGVTAERTEQYYKLKDQNNILTRVKKSMK